MSSLLEGTYLDHIHGDPVRSTTSQAERYFIKELFKLPDEQMIATLGCLMVDNEDILRSESKAMWEAFGLAVMLELGNRGYKKAD